MTPRLPALLLLAACGIPDAKPCEDPQLWYPPDASGDVYWGCEPPAGWLSEPPELADTDTDTDAETGDTGFTVTIPTGLPTPSTGDTSATVDTHALVDTWDTGLPVVDTATPVETGGTGWYDTGWLDTWDTGGLDTWDTGWLDTGLVETADTGLP